MTRVEKDLPSTLCLFAHAVKITSVKKSRLAGIFAYRPSSAGHEKWRGVSAPFQIWAFFPVDRGSLAPEQKD